MGYKTLKIQFDTIRDGIDEMLKNDPDTLNSEELIELTRQLDSLLIEYIKKSG